MPTDRNSLDDQALDEAIDLVSARFADLVAQDVQTRLLDQIVQQLSQCENEEEFARQLLAALAQRCGEHRLLYCGVDEPGSTPVILGKGYSSLPKIARSPLRHLTPGDSYILQGAEFRALLKDVPAACGLQLRHRTTLLALVSLENCPDEYILRDFLERLGERASQALCALRQRLALETARRTLHRQRQQVQKQARLLNLMDDWSQVLNRLEDRFQHLEHLLGAAVATVDGEKGSLMLLDESTGELVVRAVVGLDGEVQEAIRRGDHKCRRLKLGEGVAGKVAQTLQPMIVNQVDQEPLFLEPQLSQVSSIVCLPLHVGGLALGVLNVTNHTGGKRFQAQVLEEGMKIADQAAVAINNSRLYQLAILDPVTEVYSRSHLYQRVHDEMLRARRYQRNLSLLAINLQGLEVVRNHQGHEIGNEVERAFARLLQDATRETDMVARLSEHSFAVIMPETDALSGMFAAERICQQSRESEMLTKYYVTAHIGVCSYPDRAESVSRLISRAEMAMLAAARCNDSLPVYLSPAVGSQVLEPPADVWAAS
jgi:diguanylate cyclase (GGDEF)-like protein